MAEQFCLKWTDFHSSIVNALDSLKCSEDLVDVTLTCEGQNIKAHKVVLSACSPYFRGVFKENPCQHPVIILKDVLAEDMSRVLAYMYQGEVTVQEEHLPALLQTAQLLQVSGLTQCSPSPQMKTNAQKLCSASASNLYQKKLMPHAIAVPKKSTVSLSPHKDTGNLPVLKSIQQQKKRRNSASEKPTELPQLDHFKKLKTTKEKIALTPSKKSESTSAGIENVKTETTDNKDKTASNTELPISYGNNDIANPPSDNVALAAVKVKHEVIEDEDNDQTLPADDESEEGISPKPFYETSMLARSLISGTHSLKSDTLATSAMTKNKPVPQATSELPPTVEVKGEQLSPSGGGLEPEILISEEEGRGLGALPANHAAICGDCPHCGTQYSNQSALKYHVRLMHSDLTNRLCCYLCPRSFTVRDTFKEHMWTFHGQRN